MPTCHPADGHNDLQNNNKYINIKQANVASKLYLNKVFFPELDVIKWKSCECVPIGPMGFILNLAANFSIESRIRFVEVPYLNNRYGSGTK